MFNKKFKKDNAKTKRLISYNKEFIFSFLFSIISSLLAFLFSFLTARYLGSEKFGQINYYISIANILTTFITFGLDNYIIKNIQFYGDKRAILSKVISFRFLPMMLTLPIYFLIAYFLLTSFNQDAYIIIIVFVLAILLSTIGILKGFFTGQSKNQLSTLLSGILPHIVMIIVFCCHLVTNTLDIFLEYYIIYYAISFAIIVIPFLCIFLRHYKLSSILFTKSELLTILMFFLTWVCYNMTNSISNVVIGETYEIFGVVGIFSISNQVIKVAGLANGIIVNISYPVFSKLTKEDQKELLFKYYETVTRINIYISVPFYIAFSLEAQQLLRFFGESYTGYNLILILLSVSALVECVTGPSGSILLMGGKEKENLTCSAIKFAVYIILLVVLIKYTVYAAPIASLAGTFLANIAKLLFLMKFQKRWFFGTHIIIPCLFTAAISSAAFYGLTFVDNQILWAILNCVVGLSLIIMFILFSPYKKDKYFFKNNKNELAK